LNKFSHAQFVTVVLNCHVVNLSIRQGTVKGAEVRGTQRKELSEWQKQKSKTDPIQSKCAQRLCS
jgi:hypothetical protein